MKGHGEKLSRKREQAILALLVEPTVERAAQACGIGVATLGRWLKEKDFQASYEAVRHRIVEDALARIQHVSGEAVETLRRNLTCGQFSVEVRAALGVLEQTLKLKQLCEFESRMKTMEDFLDTLERGKS